MSREGRARWGLNQTFVIGRQDNPMMKRWRLIQTPLFGLYVHFIYREDLDPIPHDHPWTFWRMVLRGGYDEIYHDDPASPGEQTRFILPWRPNRFPTSAAHRIVFVRPGTVSLVLVGRKRRTWGFWEPFGTPYLLGRRWIDYRDALGLRPTEGVWSQAVAHDRGNAWPTVATVDLMLAQLQRDRATAYWGEPPHSRSLDGAEAWLLSLRDWLEATPREVKR